MAVPVSDLQSASPSSIIELFTLELNLLQHGANETYRFHAGVNAKDNNDIVWASNTYIKMPIEADGFEYSGNGQLPRPKVRVSNILGTISSILLGLPSGLHGAKFTRIRTLARYIDAVNFPGNVNPYGTPDPTAEFPREIYYVDRKVIETRDVVEFELAAAFDLAGVRAPKRQCIGNICQWVYRSTECGYTGPPVADVTDGGVVNSVTSAAGIAYFNAKRLFESASGTYRVQQANLLAARNNLSAAQQNWTKAETRYSRNAPLSYISVKDSDVIAYWNGSRVTVEKTYRQGDQRDTGAFREFYEIERWTLDSAAISAAQTAYDSALTAYNTAAANYNSAKATMDSAFATWQASPTYQSDLVASGDSCGKRLSSCKLRFGETAELPFGSFPGIGTYFT